MQGVTIFVRAVHLASLVLLAGSLSFTAFVFDPALGKRDDGIDAAALRQRLALLVWASLALGVISGLFWLILEARSMSGKPLADVFAQGLLGTVLTRTRFGHDWELRGFLAAPLVLCLVLALRRRRSNIAAGALRVSLTLSAAELAMIAGAGHAIADAAWLGRLHLVGDGLHLLAAGAWLGALLPLVMLLAHCGKDDRWLAVTRSATTRFSLLGIASVSVLLATGIVNSWFLVDGTPSLLGTTYGQLLLGKIALFIAMVTIAAINRLRLTPRLLSTIAPGAALRALRRNALAETVLGLGVLLLVGALGTTPPALHARTEWPLPFRLDIAALPPDPSLNRTAVLCGVGIGLGLALLLLAFARRRGRWLFASIGLALIVGFGSVPVSWMLVEAHPTTYYRSPVPSTTTSIVRGERAYVEQCAVCHGLDGRGSGPAARGLGTPPADLTAGHLLGHSEGDLFWWISHGRGEVMPGFADALSDGQRWDVVNFIRARASAVVPLALTTEVTPAVAPMVPDFTFEEGGHQQTLREATGKGPVLLIFYRLPGSLARLHQLAAAEAELRAAGLRLLALANGIEAPADLEGGPPVADFVASSDPDTASAYALFAGVGDVTHCEYLIDRAGFLRARWKAGSATGLLDPGRLMAQLNRLAQLPMTQQEPAHTHAH
jgi:putative copper export protein/mono/diheme cytochrome c family protein